MKITYWNLINFLCVKIPYRFLNLWIWMFISFFIWMFIFIAVTFSIRTFYLPDVNFNFLCFIQWISEFGILNECMRSYQIACEKIPKIDLLVFNLIWILFINLYYVRQKNARKRRNWVLSSLIRSICMYNWNI